MNRPPPHPSAPLSSPRVVPCPLCGENTASTALTCAPCVRDTLDSLAADVTRAAGVAEELKARLLDKHMDCKHVAPVVPVALPEAQENPATAHDVDPLRCYRESLSAMIDHLSNINSVHNRVEQVKLERREALRTVSKAYCTQMLSTIAKTGCFSDFLPGSDLYRITTVLSVDSGSLLAGELARVVSKASGVVPVTLPYPVHWDGPRSVVATSQTSTAELLPLLAEGTPQYHRALSLLEEDARLVVSFIGLKPGDTCSEYWGLWALLSPTLDSKSQEWELL